jgi:hypothetical protein
MWLVKYVWEVLKFYGRNLKLAFGGAYGIVNWVSTILFGVSEWADDMAKSKPPPHWLTVGWLDWIRKIQTVGGWQSLALIFGTIAVVNIILAPYWQYRTVIKERDSALKRLDIREQRRLRLAYQTKKRALRSYVKLINDGEKDTIRAMLDANFDELSNDEIIWVCAEAKSRGHEHPFAFFASSDDEEDILLFKSAWKAFLEEFRVSPYPKKTSTEAWNFFMGVFIKRFQVDLGIPKNETPKKRLVGDPKGEYGPVEYEMEDVEESMVLPLTPPLSVADTEAPLPEPSSSECPETDTHCSDC